MQGIEISQFFGRSGLARTLLLYCAEVIPMKKAKPAESAPKLVLTADRVNPAMLDQIVGGAGAMAAQAAAPPLSGLKG